MRFLAASMRRNTLATYVYGIVYGNIKLRVPEFLVMIVIGKGSQQIPCKIVEVRPEAAAEVKSEAEDSEFVVSKL